MVKYHKGNATYDMEADSMNKVLHLRASGFFSEEDGDSYLKDYDKIVGTFPTEEYALIIDAPNLKPSSPKVADMLGILLEKYMKVPFKKRFLITQGNPVAIMQFKRLGSGIPGWTESVEYVDDYSAALQKARN